VTLPSTVAVADDPLAAPALTLAAAVRRGEVSPSELVEERLNRITDVDDELGAFITVDPAGARRAARSAEDALKDGAPRGPLHGVPIAVKDLTITAGLRTTFGSRAFADFVPDDDAASVARMRAAGMVIIGKTNTCEFGTLAVTESELSGPCRNPWDPQCNAGGSSGGAACALAAGMVPIAQGTDAGGSVRVPAALCGMVGLKPSRGRISLAPRGGERLAGWATEGAIGRTLADAAALLDVMSGYELGDPYWQSPPARPFRDEVGADPGRLRVGVALAAPGGVAVEREVSAAATGAANALESLGHVVEEATPAWDGPEAEAMIVVRSTIAAYYGIDDQTMLDECNRDLAHAGATTTALQYVEASVALQRLARRIAGFWRGHDILLTPTTPRAAVANLGGPTAAAMALSRELTSFTRWFNLTGQPAVAMPAGRSRAGMPLSVQLVGAPGGEATLLRIAGQLEAAQSSLRRAGG
jgi:amidase